MDIMVSGRHMDITDAIRAYAEEKVAKLPRYFDRVQQIEVIVCKADKHHELEVIVHADKTDPFICKVEGEDLYACIDEAVDKLERQLTDHKDRLRNRKHNVT